MVERSCIVGACRLVREYHPTNPQHDPPPTTTITTTTPLHHPPPTASHRPPPPPITTYQPTPITSPLPSLMNAAFVAPRDSTSYYNLGVHLLTHRATDMAHNHSHGPVRATGAGGRRVEEGVTRAEEGVTRVAEGRAEGWADGRAEGVTLAEAMFEESILLEPKYGAAWYVRTVVR